MKRIIIITSLTHLLTLSFLHAQTFKEISSSYFFADSLVNNHTIWLDYDNDCNLDLFRTTIYGQKNTLYHYTDGRLQPDASLLSHEGGNSYGACVADIDQDGDIDCFVYNIFGQKNYLYLNQGNGSFEKKMYTIINNSENNAFHASFCDIDNDDDPDLLITDTELWNNKNSKKKTQLYINDGKGEFTINSSVDFQSKLINDRAAAWGDFNNDGFIDLFIARFGSESILYKNTGKGEFESVNTIISTANHDSNYADWTDIDNDGDLDLYVVNVRQPNALYMNHGNNHFSQITDYLITTDKRISGSANWVDLNDDGSVDLIGCSIDTGSNVVYLNEPNGNHWIRFKLHGDGINFFALGAKIQVKAIINGRSTWQTRFIGSNAGRMQKNHYDLHFGLKESAKADSVIVTWPNGKTQRFGAFEANHIWLIEENGFKAVLPPEKLSPTKESPIKDLAIRMVSDSMKTGQTYTVSMFYENKSIIPVDVTITLEMNNHFEMINAFPSGKANSNDRYEWIIKQVPPAGTGVITTAFKMTADPSLIQSEQFIKAIIDPLSADENKQNNTCYWSQLIHE